MQLMSLLTEGLWAIFGRFWNLTVILQTSIHAMSLRRRLLSLRGSPKGRVSLVRDARSSIAAAAQWIAPVDDDPETWSDSELWKFLRSHVSGTDFSRRELIDKAKRLLNKPLKSDKLEPNELLQEFKHVLNCSGPQLTCPGSTVPLHEVASDTDFRLDVCCSAQVSS